MKKLDSERARVRRYGEDSTLPQDTTKALLEWASAIHPEEAEHESVWPDGEPGEFAISTVQGYLREMRKVAERAFPELLTIDPETFNAEVDAMHAGDNPYVPEGGLAKPTLMKTQCAARTFFWYHRIAHPDAITVYGETSEPQHDENDRLTRAGVLEPTSREPETAHCSKYSSTRASASARFRASGSRTATSSTAR